MVEDFPDFTPPVARAPPLALYDTPLRARRPEHALLERFGLRLFTAHFALHQAATALAGAFIGAYLLRSGLTLPAALLVYAGLYAGRVGMRVAVLPLVLFLRPLPKGAPPAATH